MSSRESQDVRFKVILIGDINVGKSCLLMRAIGAPFPDSIPTVGGDNESRIVQRPNGSVKLTFWDTAGQERFKTTSSSYHRGANACLVVYDIGDRDSFINARGWKDEVNRYCSNDTIVVLIGNKCDLSLTRKVSFEEGKRTADEWKCDFFETSAKTKQGVDEVVDALTDLLIQTNVTSPRRSSQSIEKKRFSFSCFG